MNIAMKKKGDKAPQVVWMSRMDESGKKFIWLSPVEELGGQVYLYKKIH